MAFKLNAIQYFSANLPGFSARQQLVLSPQRGDAHGVRRSPPSHSPGAGSSVQRRLALSQQRGDAHGLRRSPPSHSPRARSSAQRRLALSPQRGTVRGRRRSPRRLSTNRRRPPANPADQFLRSDAAYRAFERERWERENERESVREVLREREVRVQELQVQMMNRCLDQFQTISTRVLDMADIYFNNRN